MSPAEQRDLLQSLLGFGNASMLAGPGRAEVPTLRRTPRTVRGFQVRVDLRYVKPPIWRRLVLPGDLALDELSVVLLEAMGWVGGHLHCFRTGIDSHAPRFITESDEEDGEEGVLEDGVRLDRVVADVGDVLCFEYDFGDGWEHIIKVEAVLPEPPDEVTLVTGRRACPPEDVGGPWGYAALAQFVESGYAEALLPEQFESVEQARDWLPPEWDPRSFDLDSARDAIRWRLGRPDNDR